jgi:cytochrome c556
MRTLCLPFLAGLVVCLGACQPPASPAGEYKTTFTIREIMDAMVMPPAEAVWGAVSYVDGPEPTGPKNDEEWTKVRRHAITLAESADLILMPGRRTAKPGEKAVDPKSQLDPEQIDALIAKDRPDWTQQAHKLHDAAMAVAKATEQKNGKELASAGDALLEVCSKCHEKYWYPNQGKPEAGEKK